MPIKKKHIKISIGDSIVKRFAADHAEKTFVEDIQPIDIGPHMSSMILRHV